MSAAEKEEVELVKKYFRAKDEAAIKYLLLSTSIEIFESVQKQLSERGIDIKEIDPMREDLCM